MTKTLAYCNIVIALLYVCCSEINAEKGQKLEYWKPNPELFESRRAPKTHPPKNKTTTTETSTATTTSTTTTKSALRQKTTHVKYYKTSEPENIWIPKRTPRPSIIDYDMNLIRAGDIKHLEPVPFRSNNNKNHSKTRRKNDNPKNNIEPKLTQGKVRAEKDSEEQSSTNESDDSDSESYSNESSESSQNKKKTKKQKKGRKQQNGNKLSESDTDRSDVKKRDDNKVKKVKKHEDTQKQRKKERNENKKGNKKERIVPEIKYQKEVTENNKEITKKDVRGGLTNKNKKYKQTENVFEGLQSDKAQLRVKFQDNALAKHENGSFDATVKKSTPHKAIGRHNTRPRSDKAILRSTKLSPMHLMEPLDDNGKPLHEGGNAGDVARGPYYLNPHGLQTELKKILADFHKVNATIEVLGRTAEYNDILIIKAKQKDDKDSYFRADPNKNIYMDEQPEKKIIFIVHGLTVMGMAAVDCLNLISSFSTLLSYYYKYLDKFDIFLIPIGNPDGYLAVHSDSKATKNMSPQDACIGVLLDRNFDVAWNGSKKVSSCSSQYPGPAPFSEVETRAVRDVLHYFGHKIVGYIHVHAGTFGYETFKGDAILYPRGYTDRSSDDDRYIDLKGEIEEMMKNASFQVMSVTVDTLHNWYGRVSGASVDYASTVFGIPYSLEFVMQPYDDTNDYPDAPDSTSNLALKEIWGRLIDTTFKIIYKGTRGNEVKRKKK